MANNIDRYLSRVNERLMSCAQRTLDEIGYILDDLESIADQHPEREDIRACIDDIKGKAKKAATETWATANHWSEHFDGLGDSDTDEPKDEPKEDAEPSEETDSDTDEE
ncbi:MAG: hypothetical protein NC184_05675 [Roseburia sp.]|nr:hypothetical protein [Roseburia sp.]